MEQEQQKRILLGLTGGIAAYKAAELLRVLTREGCEVQVAMTDAATRFITPLTLQALSGRPVLIDAWQVAANGMPHIDSGRAADLIVIAPASADFIAKLALGVADDLLSTLCLARTCPLFVAPAMNQAMWANPACQRNIARLKQDGITVLGPARGELACGEEGMGRMLEPAELAAAILASFQPKLLAGKRVLLTAGPTYEAIDAVRGITNRSSGKMGYALARAAQEYGAEVTLVSGPTALATPFGVQRIDVLSAAEMAQAVEARLPGCDMFIAVAAVADYRVAQASEHKLKKQDAPLTLQLVPNPDILARVAARPDAPFCIGFAAESQALHAQAQAKRRAKKVPLLVGNLAQQAIGADENEVILFDDGGEHPLPRAGKLTVARHILRHALQLMKTQG